MSNKVKKPIRYFGGKQTMAKEILKYYPTDKYEYYIEPFGGSYSLGLMNPYVAPIEIYNDLDKNVYSLYKVLSDKELFTQFKEKCDLCYYNQDSRKEYKNELRTNNDLSLVDRAFYFFYVNRTSHNGIGGFSVNTVIRRNMAKSVSDMLSCIDGMYDLHQRLSKVIIMNEDAFKIIEKYKNNENVFMSLDPPYALETRGEARYDVDMTTKQHLEFIDLCIGSKAKLLISGYDCPMYDKLLGNGFKKMQFDVNTTTGTHKPKQKTETLWLNY